MSDGLPFFDIILFAMIAAFLVLRLRSVLGRRDNHKRGHRNPFARPLPEEQADENVVHLPSARDIGADTEDAVVENDADGDLAAGFREIKAADRGFDPTEILSGARIAFELILSAFAAGDTEALKPLLSAEVLGNFAQSIREREAAGETMEHTLVGMKSAEIVEAYLDGRTAHVTVKFVSDQANVTRDANGEVVDGDPSAVTEVTDFWTFARDTGSRDPNWTLVATRSLD
ncbi:MAG: Tim44/TimA family putative adaptor protein [Rhodospirillales bacterium]